MPPPLDVPRYPTARYTSKAGDTLQGIALKHKLRVGELKRLNRLYTSDSKVLAGTVLTVRAVDEQTGELLSDAPLRLQNVSKETAAAASGYGVALPGTNTIVAAQTAPPATATATGAGGAGAASSSGGGGSREGTRTGFFGGWRQALFIKGSDSSGGGGSGDARGEE